MGVTRQGDEQTPPGYLELAGAALSVFLWERALATAEQPIWQQGLAYAGEVLFGMVAVDLLWYGIRGLVQKRTTADPAKIVVYGVGVLVWLGCAAWTTWRDVPLDRGIAVGSAFLLITVAARTGLRMAGRRPVR